VKLADRMIEFLEGTVGRSLAELGGPSDVGRKTLRWRLEAGVLREFGAKAKISFPSPRAIRLERGKTTVEVSS
jgi:hypothetical protein